MTIFHLHKFQSTLPHGSDKRRIVEMLIDANFNPRSLTGATGIIADGSIRAGFQSTLPHGSDYFCKRTFAPCYISIHAPSRERLADFPQRCELWQDFNPRSLTGATKFWGKGNPVLLFISIHAPSRERRKFCKFDFTERDISIHAPSRERHMSPQIDITVAVFQSTLPHGSDALR